MDQILLQLPWCPPEKRIAVRIKNKAAASIRAGHPWLFADSVEKAPSHAPTGSTAVLYGSDGKFLGAGWYDPDSTVRVKILTNSMTLPPVGPELYGKLADDAFALRSGKIPPATDAWRVIHGESDGFPGLAADVYANILSVKIYSAALIPNLREILRPLFAHLPQVDTLTLRLSREIQRYGEDVLHGIADGMVLTETGTAADGKVVFRENGIRFEADTRLGQKTGFFLDQRDNRARVRDLAAGKNVLNVFSYSGGFSLYAAAGGAKSVTSVDLDKHAIAACDRNFQRNEANPNIRNCHHRGIAGDAFSVFADLRKRGETFDLVIVDPPSFAKSKAEIPGALHSYGRLAAAAVRVTAPGGILVFASCSSRVDNETFFRTIRESAGAAGHTLDVFRETTHGVDHPAKFAESGYLKCLYAKVR